jgi:hypothetical protein
LESKCRLDIEDGKENCVERKGFYEEGRKFSEVYSLDKNIEDRSDKDEIKEIIIWMIYSLFERRKKGFRIRNVIEKTRK